MARCKEGSPKKAAEITGQPPIAVLGCTLLACVDPSITTISVCLRSHCQVIARYLETFAGTSPYRQMFAAVKMARLQHFTKRVKSAQ